MSQIFSAVITKEGEWFVAQCLEMDIASQGETEQVALEHLHEAIELHLEEPQATILPPVHKLEVTIG